MTDIVLSIVMLAALALVAGAVVLWRRTGQVKQPALMVLLAVIAVLNVLIWTIPTEGGVEVDEVDPLGPLLDPGPGRVDRRSVVGLRAGLALDDRFDVRE